MTRILWLSPFCPYDRVKHGGGQNFNYVLKYIHKIKDIEINVVAFALAKEIEESDLGMYEISNRLIEYNPRSIGVRLSKAIDCLAIWKYGGAVNGYRKRGLFAQLNAYKEYCPNIIITHWTEFALLIPEIKKIFPDCKYVAYEEDVSFLGYYRKYEKAKGIWKLYRRLRYNALKRSELNALKVADSIAVLNKKDSDLLIDNGVDAKKIVIVPAYYHHYYDAEYSPNKYDLLFWGAMSRAENYLSAIWFIDNVLPLLDDKFRFIVVGKDPAKELILRQCERVQVIGEVNDVKPYFENSLCLVAPLLLGAGIKIKVLEALSAGLPVLTNSIGEEGIGLTDKEHYLHCESAEDYFSGIMLLNNDIQLRKKLSLNGRNYVMAHYDIDLGINKLVEEIIR